MVTRVGPPRAGAGAGKETQLVRVRAVEGGYPLYGAIATRPAVRFAALAARPSLAIDPAIARALGAKIGDQRVEAGPAQRLVARQREVGAEDRAGLAGHAVLEADQHPADRGDREDADRDRHDAEAERAASPSRLGQRPAAEDAERHAVPRGTIVVDGADLGAMDEDARARFSGRHLGFVFQAFQLIPTLTALENVRVPAELAGDFALARRAGELLERVGLADRAGHYPAQLSGGEMQRVALARASLIRPRILLADEPTGNLDSANGARVLELLVELNRASTVVLVTHDHDVAGRAAREIRLRDGRIESIVAAVAP
jgi:predicted ABC-type transport system involved in lysophospholipase L1 biosynthesis ATPase subunit